MSTNADLQALGEAFWRWRAAAQPLSGDDIPRIERPSGWVPEWSADAIARRRRELARFDKEHRAMQQEAASWPVADQVDWRLLGSALARVHWELDVLRGWQRNPHFYVHQTVGALFEALLPPPPFGEARTQDLVRRLESIPATLAVARENLAAEAVRPFAELALSALNDIGARMEVVRRELAPLLDAGTGARFGAATGAAVRALEDFAEWLRSRLPGMSAETAIGRDAYVDFLRKVAILGRFCSTALSAWTPRTR